MKPIAFDAYVIDTLLPDLVGHDKRPAAFLVYLVLLRELARGRRDTTSVSLATIAIRTGLSKSTVQSALRHLKRRGLVDAALVATTAAPTRRILRPWRRRTMA